MKPTTIAEMARMGGKALKGIRKSEAHRVKLSESLKLARLARGVHQKALPKVEASQVPIPQDQPKQRKCMASFCHRLDTSQSEVQGMTVWMCPVHSQPASQRPAMGQS